MVCAPVRSIIHSLKLGDYLSVQAHKPCSISHVSDRNGPNSVLFPADFEDTCNKIHPGRKFMPCLGTLADLIPCPISS